MCISDSADGAGGYLFCRGGSLDGRGHPFGSGIFCADSPASRRKTGIGRCFSFPAAGKRGIKRRGHASPGSKGQKKRIQRQTEVYKMKKGGAGPGTFFRESVRACMRGQGYGGTKVEGKQHYGGRHLEAAAPLFLSYSDRDIFSAALQHLSLIHIWGRRVLSSSQPVTGSRRMEKRPAADMMNDSSWADFPWPARYTASTELNTAMLK